MSRPIAVIYQQLLAAKQAQTPLNSLNSSSQVSSWNLWLWITAVGQNLFEQLCDLFTANIEAIVVNAAVYTPQWIVAMVQYFQYSASVPQVVQLNVSTTYPFLTIGYPVVNSALNAISQAAVVPISNGQINIKLATGNPLGPVDGSPGTSGPICTALTSYLNEIMPANLHYELINDNADLIYINGQIWYNAAYSGIISANVIAAINTYLSSLPFNGVVTITALESAILAVPGVEDLELNNVMWRQATDPAPTGGTPPTNMNNLILDNTLIERNYRTYAGYVIPETTSGYTLTTSLTFTPQ